MDAKEVFCVHQSLLGITFLKNSPRNPFVFFFVLFVELQAYKSLLLRAIRYIDFKFPRRLIFEEHFYGS